MTVNDIINQIQLNRHSGEALRAQLERKLAELIRCMPEGSSLPPERQIATALGVSRVTVRGAFQGFLDRGEIVRRPRHGTRVAARSQASAVKNQWSGTGNSTTCDFSFPWLATPVVNLKMVLYETLPQQKAFWQKVAGKFSETRSDCSIKLIWQESPGCEKYRSLCAANSNTDIFLYSPTIEKYLPELAVELPENLQCKLADFPGSKSSGLAALSKWLLPVHLACAYTYWNPKLAEKYQIDNVQERLLGGEFFDLVFEAAGKLPENCMAAGHVWDYLSCYGHAAGSPVDSSLENIIELLSKFQKKKNSFHCSQRYPLDIIDDFIGGQQLFLTTYISQLDRSKNELLDMKKVPAFFTSANTVPCCFIAAAVSSASRFRDEAFAFMEFLAGEYVQQYCRQIKDDLPFDNAKLPEALQGYGFSSDAAHNFIRRLMLMGTMSGSDELYSQFCTFRTRKVLNDLLGGRISCRQAVSEIREKWNLFYRQFAGTQQHSTA